MCANKTLLRMGMNLASGLRFIKPALDYETRFSVKLAVVWENVDVHS